MKFKMNKSLRIFKKTFIFVITILLCNKSSFVQIYNFEVVNNNVEKFIEEEVIMDNYEELYSSELYEVEITFSGDLTAYVGDCPLCSGILACTPTTNVLETGIYFTDDEYGEVRIVSTSSDYPCGTIIRFESERVGEDPIVAIAMDRGVSGNSIDLLVDDVDFAIYNVGRTSNQIFEVLRIGW